MANHYNKPASVSFKETQQASSESAPVQQSSLSSQASTNAYLLNRGYNVSPQKKMEMEDKEQKNQEKTPNDQIEHECLVNITETSPPVYESKESVDLYQNQCSCTIVFIQQTNDTADYQLRFIRRLNDSSHATYSRIPTRKRSSDKRPRYSVLVEE